MRANRDSLLSFSYSSPVLGFGRPGAILYSVLVFSVLFRFGDLDRERFS